MKKNIIEILKRGGVGVMPTDTLYGLLGSALNKKTVERIYKLRKRDLSKPFIILISSLNELSQFGVTDFPKQLLSKIWPGKVSVILPLSKNFSKFKYLHRGTKKLAFRIPKSTFLIDLLKKTGPLVAPSANPQGKNPAKNTEEARKYFGGSVDFYTGKKILKSKGSTIIEWRGELFKPIREGDVPFNKLKLKIIPTFGRMLE